MKTPKLLSLGALAVAAVSCGSFKNLNRPLSGGGFDPLDSPGSSTGSASAVVAPTKPSYKRGQWVETSMPNATFFRAFRARPPVTIGTCNSHPMSRSVDEDGSAVTGDAAASLWLVRHGERIDETDKVWAAVSIPLTVSMFPNR